jgi:hypothetical protein
MNLGDNVFSDDDVNTVFNNFLSIYLRIYYNSFPLKKYIHNYKKNNKLCITARIKISCIYKRDLYMLGRNKKPWIREPL